MTKKAVDQLMKADFIALGGPPGCGKSSMINYVIRPYCEEHGRTLIVIPVSAQLNAYLDSEAGKDDAAAQKAQRIRVLMSTGHLVPDKETNMVVLNAVDQVEKKEEAVYVLDGAPRTRDQIDTALIEVPHRLGIPSDRRTMLRFITRSHLCGYRAALRARGEDDFESSFQTRWGEYETYTKPAMDFVEKNKVELHVNFKNIDGASLRESPNLYKRIVFSKNGDMPL